MPCSCWRILQDSHPQKLGLEDQSSCVVIHGQKRLRGSCSLRLFLPLSSRRPSALKLVKLMADHQISSRIIKLAWETCVLCFCHNEDISVDSRPQCGRRTRQSQTVSFGFATHPPQPSKGCSLGHRPMAKILDTHSFRFLACATHCLLGCACGGQRGESGETFVLSHAPWPPLSWSIESR